MSGLHLGDQRSLEPDQSLGSQSGGLGFPIPDLAGAL